MGLTLRSFFKDKQTLNNRMDEREIKMKHKHWFFLLICKIFDKIHPIKDKHEED